MASDLTLNEDDARAFYLVRAAEQEDGTAQLLTEEDRLQATAHAVSAAAQNGGEGDAAYLAARSRFAAARLATRHPAIDTALKRSRWPAAMTALIPLAAFIAGVVSNELDGGGRLELLGFPLLGVIAWNLVIYGWMFVRMILRRKNAPALARLPFRAVHSLSSRAPGVTGQALARFAADWSAASVPLASRRIGTTLHLSAALFALGLCAGIFLRALTVEYRAGWESTFLDAGQVHAILAVILGPASTLTGIEIPSVSGIGELRWSGGEAGGTNAGPWIKLWAATLVGVVVLPRLIFAGWNRLRAFMRTRSFTIPGRENFYVRRLLRAREGGGGAIRITPYAYTPDAASLSALEHILRQALGDRIVVQIDPPVLYGAEDEWLKREARMNDLDLHIALFSMTATPENENHGAFLQGLQQRHKTGGTGVKIGAIVDEAPFAKHFAGQAGAGDRLAARAKSWETMVQPIGVNLLRFDLSSADNAVVSEAIESALLGGALQFTAQSG